MSAHKLTHNDGTMPKYVLSMLDCGGRTQMRRRRFVCDTAALVHVLAMKFFQLRGWAAAPLIGDVGVLRPRRIYDYYSKFVVMCSICAYCLIDANRTLNNNSHFVNVARSQPDACKLRNAKLQKCAIDSVQSARPLTLTLGQPQFFRTLHVGGFALLHLRSLQPPQQAHERFTKQEIWYILS